MENPRVNKGKFYIWFIITVVIFASAIVLMQMLLLKTGRGEESSNEVQYYLTIGADGVKSIDYSMPGFSGGCENADGSLFEKGSEIWLEFLDNYEGIEGLVISAYDINGKTIWKTSVPIINETHNTGSLSYGDWKITNSPSK